MIFLRIFFIDQKKEDDNLKNISQASQEEYQESYCLLLVLPLVCLLPLVLFLLPSEPSLLYSP